MPKRRISRINPIRKTAAMMNKKERALVEALTLELSIARAMCFKEYAPKQIDTQAALEGKAFSDLVVAWYANTHNCSASQGCFNAVHHSVSSTTKTSTQQRGGPWYETKREALMAIRVAKQRQFAEVLASLDRQIEAES